MFNPTYCGNFPHVDHSNCPSSVECTANMCACCELNTAGHGHFALYCSTCAEHDGLGACPVVAAAELPAELAAAYVDQLPAGATRAAFLHRVRVATIELDTEAAGRAIMREWLGDGSETIPAPMAVAMAGAFAAIAGA